MQVSVDTLEGLQRRMSVELPSDQFDDEVSKRLKQLSQTARMDGFRPGKIPMSMVNKRFGAQVKEEVFGEMIDSTFYQAALKEKLKPAGAPSVEKMDGDVIGYIATFEVLPEIEIGDLSGAVVNTPVATIGDADVDNMIEKLCKQRATFEEVSRESEDTDRLTIDFKGTIDGEIFEGGVASDIPLVLGSKSMIDGFESGLLGAKAGDTRNLSLKFPDDYQAEHLAGKDADFEVEVKKVEAQKIPDLDENMVKEFGVVEGTEEALRSEIRANMERELAAKLKTVIKHRTMNALLDIVSPEVPETLVSQESERMKQQALSEMQASGGQTMDLNASVFRDGAERRVQLGLVMSEYARKNNIQPDEAKIRETVEEMAQGYESPAEFVEYYMNNQEHRANIEAMVMEDMATEVMIKEMQTEEEATDFDSLMELNA